MKNYNYFWDSLQSRFRSSVRTLGTRTPGTGNRWVFGVFSLCLLISATSADAATYYRWVDDEGTTHYTSAPPQGRPSEKVNSFSQPDPSPSESSATPSTNNTDNNGNDAQAKAAPQQTEKFEDPERCEAARKRVETLKSNQRIRMKTEDGDFRYLNQEDIAEELAKSQEAIEESC